MNKKGQLIVVSGPSGVGKGTVLKEYLASRDQIAYSVSATTRSPRPGEEHGVHYFFLSREEFEQTVQSGGMLEYAKNRWKNREQKEMMLCWRSRCRVRFRLKKHARMHC